MGCEEAALVARIQSCLSARTEESCGSLEAAGMGKQEVALLLVDLWS